jgi:dTDP-4-dehydrorhamnose reductase
MKVVIIGSTGQLGHDLMRVFSEAAVGLTHRDIDVTDALSVTSSIQRLKPDWVLNAAAFHRVDDCEFNPCLALAVNTMGASNVARAAAAVSAGVVFFSTDYVFGQQGRQRGNPYREGDLPGPINIYGVSKWAGEQLVVQGNPKHLLIRSAGLYGSATSRKGWTFPELMLQKGRKDGIVRVVTDQVLSPTSTADLSTKVKQLITKEATGLFHVVNAGECSWFEFARAVFEIAGVHAKIEPITTDASQRRALRPSYSALSSIRLAELRVSPTRPWKDALTDYLRQRGLV